ncbi:MAG: AEC family transporter [Anaerovoracaceae bacterium]|nr:AEC family transporter [Anaerovoracaceae bacterium]
MATMDIITALAKIFIIMLPGYILKKTGVLSKQHVEGMSSLITNVTFPCMIIVSMQMEFSMEILNNCKNAIIVFSCIIAVTMVLARVVSKRAKLPRTQSGIFAFMLMFGNTGFIGFPVLSGLFGQEAVLYGALCDAVYNIFMFTIGIALIKPGDERRDRREVIRQTVRESLNPCFFGLIIGLVLFIGQISLPEIIGGPMESIGNITSPLAMIVIGAHLAEINFGELFRAKHAYVVCLLKLIVTPLIGLVFVKLIIGTGSLLASAIIIEAAMPVAMCSVIFSEQYKADVNFAVKGVMLTTVMCIVTIPVFAILLQYI